MAEEKINTKPETKEEKVVETEEKTEDKKEISAPAVEKAEVKPKEKKVITAELTREYIVPLRKQSNKVPRYKRAKKAVKALKEFIAKHMRVENRDLNRVKVDIHLNNEIWFRGIKKPANKIKVKAVKREGIVTVTLAETPEIIKYKIQKLEKRKAKAKKTKKKEKAEKKSEEKPEKSEEKKTDEKEKEKASVEAGLEKQKQQAKELKHTAKGSHAPKAMPQRKALKK